MLQVSRLIPQGQGLAPVLVRRAPHLELDWDIRQKSRFDATASNGQSVGVFLPRGTVVRGGDVLLAQDGSLLRVVAAPQPVLRITACTDPHHGHSHAPAHEHPHIPAFDLMRDGLRLIALDRHTVDRTQTLIAALAGGADGLNLVTAIGQTIARLADANSNPALRALPNDRQKTARREGQNAAYWLADPDLHQPASETAAAIDCV